MVEAVTTTFVVRPWGAEPQSGATFLAKRLDTGEEAVVVTIPISDRDAIERWAAEERAQRRRRGVEYRRPA